MLGLVGLLSAVVGIGSYPYTLYSVLLRQIVRLYSRRGDRPVTVCASESELDVSAEIVRTLPSSSE